MRGSELILNASPWSTLSLLILVVGGVVALGIVATCFLILIKD